MTTLLYQKIGQGKARVCDARCYDAKSTVCHCVCEGRNHGKGLKRAIENTKALAQEWLDGTSIKRKNLEWVERALAGGNRK